MAADASDIDIVIPNWNGMQLLHACLESVRQARGDLDLRLVVVDNASSDGSVELLRATHPEVEILENAVNEGFARACNRGAAAGTARSVLLLNTDALVQPGVLARLLHLLDSTASAAVVAPQLRNSDGTFQSSRSPFPHLWREPMVLTGLGRVLFGSHYPSHAAQEELGPQRADWVGGACMLVRRTAWNAMGGFDEGYFMYAEEMDLCYRLRRAGWEVWYEPRAVVVHLGGGSARRIAAQSEARQYKSLIRFYRKHYGAGRAAVLRGMIFAATAVKISFHGAARIVSGGRRGRQVVSLRRLRAELRREV